MSIYWMALLIAGLCEVGWPLGLKLADAPGLKVWGLILAIVSMAISGALLWFSLKEIPIGTAYAVWTGIGTIGTAILGIALLGEPASALRLACIGLIVAGIVGLKLFSGAH